MTYTRKGDRYEWASRTAPRGLDPVLRCGQDVTIRGKTGHWMIVGFDGPDVVIVGVDVPGERQVIRPGKLRVIEWEEAA